MRQSAYLVVYVISALLLASRVMSAEPEPVARLAGSAAAKTGQPAGDTAPVHVIRTGKETLEWALPETTPGAYLLGLTVRTGNTSSNPLNLVRVYRACFVDTAGKAGPEVSFGVPPSMKPKRTSKKWPHYVGDILSTEPVFVSGPGRLRVRASAHWAEVREVRFIAAPERDRVSFSLVCGRAHSLFRSGEPVVVSVRVASYLDRSMTGRLAVKFLSPAGSVLQRVERDVTLGRFGVAGPTVRLESPFSGCHTVVLEGDWDGHTYTDELAVGIVRVPPASELGTDSPFAVHPGGLNRLYQSGFKWIRLWDSGDVWCAHERAGKGQFDFAATEEKVANFLADGFEVLAVLAYSPTWASRHPEIGYYCGAGAPFPPRNIEDWRDYCREYMTRFKGRIRYFEVWNEPNTGNTVNLERGFFRGTVADYVTLLKVAYETARSVDPGIRIVGGSGTGDFLSWTEAILAAGAGPYMDVLSFHAYSTPHSPENANLEGRLKAMKRIMAKHGVAELPLWNTEVGYWQDRRPGARPATEAEIIAKAPKGLAPNWQASWPYRPITEDDAAAFAVRHYYLNVAAGVEKLFWYSSISSGQPLLCEDGSLRLICFAVANAAHQLDGLRYRTRVDLGISKLHVHLWGKRGTPQEATAVIWHAGRGEKGVVLPAGTPRDAIDIWGNPIELPVEKEGVLVSAGRDPIIIRGSTERFARARLRSRRIVIPVDDCVVVNEVNADRPVKNHTSPAYHGDRRVYGLPDPGDALGWELRGIRPGSYRVEIELRTGSAGNLYGSLDCYDLRHVHGGDTRSLPLGPTFDPLREPVAIVTQEGRGRAYGWAAATQVLWLEPGDQIQVHLVSGFGFVGGLMLSEAAEERLIHPVSRVADVVLDGKLDETRGLTCLDVRQRRQVVLGVADPFASTAETDAWRGPEDLSAAFWVGWLKEGLYVAVDIRDQGGIFPSKRGPYNGDCIELFLDLRGEDEVGSAVVSEGVYQIMLRAPEADHREDVAGRTVPGTRGLAWRTAAGWQAELLVPFAGVKEGLLLGVDLAVDDDDSGAGRKSQIVWHGTSQNYQDPSAYGRVRLR